MYVDVERGNYQIRRYERCHFSLCVGFPFPIPTSVHIEEAAWHSTSLLWQYLSVLVTFSLPSLFIERESERARQRREKIGRGGRRGKEREEEGERKRLHPMVFALLLLPPMRRNEGTDGPTDGPSHGMVKPVSFARQMDGRRMGWIYPRRTHRQTDRLTDAARFDETARGRR